MWIVQDDKITAAARHGAARTQGKIFALLGGLPLASCGHVRVDLGLGEDVMVFVRADGVADLTAKINGQISGVGGLDDIFGRVMA